MLASTIVDQVRAELSDPDATEWTDADMISYVNSAQKALILVRPDAKSAIENLLLTAGETLHSLASTSLRLLNVIRNMGADGSTPGAPIRMVKREDQDLYNQSWHSATGKAVIREVMYDEDVPDQLFTNPPAHASKPVYIQIVVSKLPTDITALSDSIDVKDVYEQALRTYILHLAYAVEIESNTSSTKSRQYLQDFYNILGIKTKVDVAHSPSKEVRSNG